MTSGTQSFGGTTQIGSFSLKVWSGADRPTTGKPAKWPRGVLLDIDGHELDRRYASKEELARARIRKRVFFIKKGLTPKPKKEQSTPHPYTCTWRKGVNAPMTQLPSNGPYAYEYLFGGVAWGSDDWNSNDDLKLINKLRSKIQGSDFNLGVFIAEGGQALGMIGDSAIKLASAYVFAQKGNYHEATRVLTDLRRHVPPRNSVANNWLELQYGWKPLIEDMEAGAIWLSHMLYDNQFKRYKVSRQIPRAMKTAAPTLVGLDAASWGFTRKSIIALVEEVDVAKLVGLTDVASIAWEKLPYSFVADWAIPIGNFLSARGVANSLKGTFVTTRVDRYYCKLDRDIINSGGEWIGAKQYWAAGGELKRSVSTVLDVPMPSFKKLSKVASWQHAANAVALLSQSFGQPNGWKHLKTGVDNHAITY